MKIYHNPRCTKSRQALELLKENGHEPEIIEYLKTLPSKEELKEVIALLNISPFELIRTKEKLFIEEFKGKKFTDEEYLDIMLEHPKLIERPIIIANGKAVIGRPTEKILTLLNS